MNDEGEQLTLFGPDTWCGKMSPEPSVPAGAMISTRSLRKPAELQTAQYLYLDLRAGYGSPLGPLWEINSPSLGEYWTLNTGPSPKDAEESYLSQILEVKPLPKYYLSPTACRGILRRASVRGKELPPTLKQALELQAAGGIDTQNQGENSKAVAFACNQRDEVRNLYDVSGTILSQQGMKQQTFVAAFSAGQGSKAGGIEYKQECSPTLKASESGSNMVPAVLCLNDQGGNRMD